MPKCGSETYAAPVSDLVPTENTDGHGAARRLICTRLDQLAAVAYSALAVPLVLNEAATVKDGAVGLIGLAAVGWAIAARRRRPVPALALCLAGLGLFALAVPRASVVGFGGLVAVVYAVAASATARLAATALA